MKLTGFLIIVTLLATMSFFLTSCSKTILPNMSGNLVPNPGFESNGLPSLAGWKVNNSDWVKVVSNSPPGSTSWSLCLSPSFGPTPGGIATTGVTGQSGTGVYSFSCWERNFAGWYWGYVSLEQVRNGQVISDRNLTANDTMWTMFTIDDTLSLLTSDTLRIGLHAPSLAVASKRIPVPEVDSVSYGVCFNQISLTRSQ